MIRLEGLRHVAADGSLLLDDINLRIAPGERIGIAGASGSGKTTLGYHLCGIHDKALADPSQGRVLLDGRDCALEDCRGFAGVVLQNPEPQLFGETVEEEVGLGLENLGWTPREIKAVVDRTLDTMGLVELRQARTHTLSLGLKQRLSIAAMLAMCPKVLFLDEPTNYLDRPTADSLFAMLPGLGREITTIVVEHDLERLAAWATRIIVMDSGRIAYDGLPEPAARMLSCSLDGLRRTQAAYLTAAPLISARNLVYGHAKGQPVLNGVSLEAHPGEIVALRGANGSGKSTLLHLLKGLLKPWAGTVAIKGGASPMEAVGLVFQNPDEQIFAHSVEAECAYVLRNRKVPDAERSTRTMAALRDLGLEDKAARLPLTLSYGEKRRLALASVLVGDPAILCLDEPTVALDPAGLHELARLFFHLADEGKSIIFATHDLRFAEAVATRYIDLDFSRIVADVHNSPHGEQ